MKNIHPYLTFNGNCREAMNFYKDCLGGDLQVMTFGDSPMKTPDAAANERVMHARLSSNAAILMASDSMPDRPVPLGGNFSISVECEGEKEMDAPFAALAGGGQITMPLQDTFWGARFGMLTDKYGINWMFNFDKPQAGK